MEQNPQINTCNPEAIIYITEELGFTILGGIRLEGLDRLRVTLRIEVNNNPRPPVRHNLDLYNDNQLEKLYGSVPRN